MRSAFPHPKIFPDLASSFRLDLELVDSMTTAQVARLMGNAFNARLLGMFVIFNLMHSEARSQSSAEAPMEQAFEDDSD